MECEQECRELFSKITTQRQQMLQKQWDTYHYYYFEGLSSAEASHL